MKIPPYLTLKNGAILLAVSVAAAFLSRTPPFNILEKRLLNHSFQIRGAEPPHPDLVIIEINDESLHRVGSWPWPRGFHGQFLKILAPAQAKVIFFDMFFPEKSNEQNDALFAEGIEKAGNVILSYYFPATQPKEMREPQGLPIEVLKKSAKHLGFVNVFPDSDGYVREIKLKHSDQGRTYYHSSLVTAAEYFGWVQKDLQKIPEKPFLINFPGPYLNFRVIPYEKIIQAYGYPGGKALFDSLKGKALLIGHTATGTALDLKPSPFSTHYPGVALQASMVHTLLTGKYIRRLPLDLHILMLFCFLILILSFTQNRKPVKGFLFTFASLVIAFLLIQVCFIYFRLWIPFASFGIPSLLVFLTITLYSFVKVHFEKELYSRELSLATKIQANLLRSEMPEIPGIEIAAVMIPARHVGGDLYDIITVDQTKCGISIGDVSGKGVPAALFMSKAISEFRRESHALNPSEVIKNLNIKLAEGGFSGLFITMLYLIIDPKTRSFVYANGGHDPLFFYQKSKNEVAVLVTETGGPLGIDEITEFDQKEAQAELGDILILETDGIKEAMNAKRELFGLERIQAAIIEAADKPAAEIIQHLQLRVSQFVKNAPQHDDMTIVCAKFV